MLPPSLHDLQQSLTAHLRPWQRSLEFWVRAADIYTGYKACQFKVGFVKDEGRREAMWERQHEVSADKMYSLCSEMGGLFLKAAQILGKPDLAPAAWVRRLVTLCDQAPATPFDAVQHILEKELGNSLDELFERFDIHPVGSASIAQVHRARLRCTKTDVAVKVQHPGVQHLMMIAYEFDFALEGEAMERIRRFIQANNKKVPVIVPRVINGMVTRKVLVMEFIDGIPIMNLGNEIARRGIDPTSKIAAFAKQKILQNLTLVYGQMILKAGFFHADPHPGNILICKDSEVALLDYGQVKHLPDNLRLGYANLILAIADNDPLRASQSFKELGIETLSTCVDEQKEFLKLAQRMFDTWLPPGVTLMSPFSEESSLNKVAVKSFPEELFCVLRTIQLLRGLSVGLGINYSCAEHWRPIAEEAMYQAGRLKVRKRGFLGTLFRRKREYEYCIV